MELKYSRLFLSLGGLFFVLMGTAVCLLFILSDAPFSTRVARIFVTFLGETGAFIVLITAGILTVVMGGRLFVLLGDGASAVKVTSRGVEVRSVFHTGLLKWADIGSIGLAPMPMAPNKSGLEITPKHRFSEILRFLALSESITIGCQMLKANEAQVEEWIARAIDQSAQPARRSASHASKTRHASNSQDANAAAPAQPAATARPSFGRKVV